MLNGASSSGKSTLAAAVQQKLEEPFLHFSFDHLIAAGILPNSRIDAGEFRWCDLRPAFFEGVHRCIPALATAGNNLIVEHIVETEEWMDNLLTLLSDFDVFFVGIHCPLDELERREAERGDLRIGDACRDFERPPTSSVPTTSRFWSTDPLEENADKVIAAWKSRVEPSAFQSARQL